MKTNWLPLIFALVAPLNATTYYVDPSHPNANDNSLTPWSPSTPWASMDKVNNTTFSSGDVICLARGNLWRGQLTIKNAGVTVDAYGSTGEAEISGAVVVTSPISEGTNIYYKAWLCAPQQVFFNGIRGTKVTNITDLTANNRWCYVNSTGRLYYYHDNSPYAPIVEATVYTNAVTLVSGATADSTLQHRYSKSFAKPHRVFFGKIVGTYVQDKSNVTANNRYWYDDLNDGDDATGTLWYYRDDNAAVEVATTSRPHAVLIQASNVTINNILVERTDNSGIVIDANCNGTIVNNVDVLQWSNEVNASIGGVKNSGANTEIKYCTFGKEEATGGDAEDENWSGYIAILSRGANATVRNNHIMHTSAERFAAGRDASNGMRFDSVSTATISIGTTTISNNTIEHVGGHGIGVIGTYSNSNDLFLIYGNTISYTGQAGISIYQTRLGENQTYSLVTGHIYANDVSYANRLGDPNGNRASGIHFNDGKQSDTDANRLFIKWKCYDNLVHHSHSIDDPNTTDTEGVENKDSDGIAIDFNANKVEVYRNAVYQCDGKGIYVYNADDANVHHNLVWGNDQGIMVLKGNSLEEQSESCVNNVIAHNTLYKNYNANTGFYDYSSEILFGQKSNGTKVKNNVIYVTDSRYALRYVSTDASNCEVDGNLYYSTTGVLFDDSGTYKNFTNWRSAHLSWDANSVATSNPNFLTASPDITTALPSDFIPLPISAAINGPIDLSYLWDHFNAPMSGAPDRGAIELQSVKQEAGTSERVLHYSTSFYHYGQSFRLPMPTSKITRHLSTAQLKLRKQGTVSGSFKVDIHPDDGTDRPNLGVTIGSSSPVAASSIGAEAWYDFVFPAAPLLNANTKYHLVLKSEDAPIDSSNFVAWKFTTTDAYETGQGYDANIVLSNGLVDTGNTYDLAFRIYYSFGTLGL